MDILEILRRLTIWSVMYLGPVWIAFLLGLMLGWSFCKFQLSSPSNNNSFTSTPFRVQTSTLGIPTCSSSNIGNQACLAVKQEDFDHLWHLVERNDGGLPWRHMMDRSTHNMSYQAWMRNPETGPPQYCSRTVYEDATPEMLRDFFWDDEFRLKWDDMILHTSTIEECPTTGTMTVHWIRKFPFFCSDREYTIGRRIWETGRTYYCVTKICVEWQNGVLREITLKLPRTNKKHGHAGICLLKDH